MSKPRHHTEYDPARTPAIHAALERVLRCFGPARVHVTLIGGLVPALLVPDASDAHVGTTDIDLCLTFALAEGETGYYEETSTQLRQAGFRPEPRKQFRWKDDNLIVVDFLRPSTGESDPPLRSLRVGDEWERAALVSLGPDFAALSVGHGALVERSRQHTEFQPVIDGARIPDAYVHVTGPLGFLALKADALGADGRYEPKDAYDVIWLLEALNPDDAAADAAAFTIENEDLASEVVGTVAKLEQLFSEPDLIGPMFYAQFLSEGGVADPSRQQFATATVMQFVAGYRGWMSA